MNPTLRTTYLALSKAGQPVASFGTPELARAFARKRRLQGVKVELVEETVIRKPLSRGEAIRLVGGKHG